VAGIRQCRAAVISSSASPYNADGTNRIALANLIGWLGWTTWIVSHSVALLRL
jgi:hypothetical protein